MSSFPGDESERGPTEVPSDPFRLLPTDITRDVHGRTPLGTLPLFVSPVGRLDPKQWYPVQTHEQRAVGSSRVLRPWSEGVAGGVLGTQSFLPSDLPPFLLPSPPCGPFH